jgi:transcriptional regulator with XRE-family HTH domain
VRQLAEKAGVSNPYLSQIERGLRKPSADVLNQIAKALRVSAEVLYVRAGMLEPSEASDVRDAVIADTAITERQKQALLEIYTSFVDQNAVGAAPAATSDAVVALEATSDAVVALEATSDAVVALEATPDSGTALEAAPDEVADTETVEESATD